MSLLDKLLSKRGIDKVEDLTPEEHAVFKRYQIVLSKDPISVDQIQKFCQIQIKLIESKCDGISPLSMIQQGSIHVYSNILKLIEAPIAEREALERYLTTIIET